MNLVPYLNIKKLKQIYIHAFTLIEILVVLAITSVVLLFNYDIAMSLSQGFISSSSSKALLEFIRTTKQLAILNTENYDEYLMGMGIMFTKDQTTNIYIVKRLKYRTTGVYTFLNYQNPTNFSNFIELPQDSYNSLRIPKQIKLELHLDNNQVPISCDGSILIIFESLFGRPHLYCVLSPDTITTINFNNTIDIYMNNTKNKIIIKKNGETYGTFK